MRPILELFRLLGKIIVDNAEANRGIDDTTEKAEKSHPRMKAAFEKIGDVARAVGKIVAAGLGVASGAILKLSKGAIESYADYEQLVGGVETLFKDSAGMVMAYADEAYKTAGLSANQYMETVTGFSASLLQSLNGNTRAAAVLGNQAVIDMSDNANKMGTSMESIQNAYAGFAKGNYTMLDNLKLGYGGTKEEMHRLLEDAHKMGAITQAELEKADFGTIIKAIHGVQEQMGITGTTAKEAASTISGSFGMLKGAWSNLITGLMDENANIPDLVNNVTTSATTLFENAKPKIEQFFQAIPEAIHNMLAPYPEVQVTVDQIIAAIQNIADAVEKTIRFIVDHWSIIEPILAAAAVAVGVITGAITLYNTVMAVKTAMDAAQVTSLGALIAAKWADVAATTAVLAPYALIVAAIAAVIAIIVVCVKHWDEIKEKVLEVAQKIKDVAVNMFEKGTQFFKNIWEKVTGFFADLFARIKDFFKTVYAALVHFFEDPFYYIGYAIGFIFGMIKRFFVETIPNAWADFKKWFNQMREKVVSFFNSIPGKFQKWLSSIHDRITNFGKNVRAFFSKAISSLSDFAKNAVEKATQGAKDLFNNVVNWLRNLPENLRSIGKNAVEGLWNGIHDKIQWLKDQIKKFADGILDGIKDALGIHSPSTVFRDEVGENLALGLGEGFEHEMNSVEKRMKNAIPTDFDVTARMTDSVNAARINRPGARESMVETAAVQAILPELYAVIVRALKDGVKIQWKERELARLVKTYAD